jgi:hypothetical protein
MSFNATLFFALCLLASCAFWLWRFVSLLRTTPRALRAAALRGLASGMGSEFWPQGNPYQDELAAELGSAPDSIVHTLRWPNAHAEIFSFQEARYGAKRRMQYHDWIGYRFSERSFPNFDLKPAGLVPFIRRGWWRKVSLPGQIDFASRFVLTGEDEPAIEQFFTPERCAAILSREWPRSIGAKVGGRWLLCHRERLFQSSSESDSESGVSEEIRELSSLVTGMLPLAEALTGEQLKTEPSQQYAGLAQDAMVKKEPRWRSGLALLASASAIVILILWSVLYFSPLWERFDRVILQTEPRRYLFAIVFVAVWWAINEWGIRNYHQSKEKAAARLEARFSGSPNSLQ